MATAMMTTPTQPHHAPTFQRQANNEKPLLIEPIPFENSWAFWLDKYTGPGLTVEEYEASLLQLGVFSTVQEFWRWFNNLPKVDKLQPRMSYHMMKQGVKPLWEHEANVNGGNLAFKIRKEDTNLVWLRLILSVVGEQFLSLLNEYDEICGITISIRKAENVIDIWNKRAELMDVPAVYAFVQQLVPEVKFSPPTYNVHRAQTDFAASKK
eukprot:TRINITY_DN1939_c0_g1_i1.p1 TRINITY_DN1939_c0_g1~~TRINITY_DN1939_c0_g1_i1.p1  ORF type:complete len:210 (-),score=44.93 TRINITY_DN1939_c0_g1_i1:209-838(-)